MAVKSSVSQASSYADIGAYWDTHDGTEFGDSEEAEFHVHLQSERHYFPVDDGIWQKLRSIADQRGVSDEALLNTFLKDRIDDIERDQGRK